MKSELSFLLELALDDEVPKPIKTKVVQRIRDVEKTYGGDGPLPVKVQKKAYPISPNLAHQAPSTQRILEQNPDLIPKAPVPVTREAAEALNHRQALINGALNEKPEKGRTSPRKF